MRKRNILAVGVAAAAAVLATAVPASSHGYITTPPSRAGLCGAGVVKNCGQIQWEPQSVEGPKGFPNSGPADGTLCAGGDSRWAPLDNPRSGAWPTTKVTAGQQLTLTWSIEARHATTSFRYFLTKPGYDATTKITRSNLNLTPFLTVPMGGKQPPATLSHTGTLPSGLTGHQVILAVWDIADTGNAFYQCMDVNFS
ncbi:lytic polysaccharide monooxygenase auxiliary activity family 9 protein [Kitasatospora phosalacinea]|uniref:lytic polysaccharide monooxygenase auxiliary activity family 9 protein n=1 Tax=Kitasatospora phosalacinea TaxID=2065 RepID=UPI0005261E5D|nr:lytic polysaccharide monooxygenase [Kitasatospora phosalacinea]